MAPPSIKDKTVEALFEQTADLMDELRAALSELKEAVSDEHDPE